MKKKFFRSCFALLLSMVLLLGGVKWDAAAIGDVSPFGPVRPTVPVTVNITSAQTVMNPGDTQYLSCSVDPSGGTLSWVSSSPSVATVSSSGYVQAISSGTTTITARYTYSDTVYTDSVVIQVQNITDVTGIKNSTEYYIMNVSSNYFLGLEHEQDTAYTNAYLMTKFDFELLQWRVDLQSDGTYQLISVYSTTDKCLHVNGSYLCINTDINSSSQKFTIERVTSGDYAGLYLIKYGDKYVSKASAYRVGTSTTLTNDCYWSFMAVEKRWADLFAFDYKFTEYGVENTFDTTGNSEYFESVMEELGYYTCAYENLESYYAYTFLRGYDDIFVYRGHGAPGRLEFCTTNDAVTGRIIAHTGMGYSGTSSPYYINNYADNALCLSRCVLYIGCETAVSSGQYNLLQETFNKGAHFVLGTTQTVQVGQSDNFLRGFLKELYENKTNIDTCILKGLATSPNYPIDYIGDTYQYLD